eukprot:6187923-Pyramimonas_sp.AAC.1
MRIAHANHQSQRGGIHRCPTKPKPQPALRPVKRQHGTDLPNHVSSTLARYSSRVARKRRAHGNGAVKNAAGRRQRLLNVGVGLFLCRKYRIHVPLHRFIQGNSDF